LQVFEEFSFVGKFQSEDDSLTIVEISEQPEDMRVPEKMIRPSTLAHIHIRAGNRNKKDPLACLRFC
jgi:hypothetical protein